MTVEGRITLRFPGQDDAGTVALLLRDALPADVQVLGVDLVQVQVAEAH